jgi:death-on-curing protein
MSQAREKFATQVNSEILAAVRTLADKEGRQIQALADEALADLIEKHKNAKPRPHVMGAYFSSNASYGPLYKKLAEMSDFLTVAELLAMHSDLIERYGGSHGVRDQGLLEAALYRPQTGYYTDLVEEAAALWETLSQNHPSIDGNKRTAFAATYTFLAINGARLTADAQETFVFVNALYQANQFSFDKLVPWLRSHVR